MKEGDCVSVPNSYFGDEYLQILKKFGVEGDKIYGRVSMVVDGNRNFQVRWDLDQEISKSMSLDKVTYEPPSTPLQVNSSTSTSAPDLEQTSSSNAAKTHAVVVEQLGEASTIAQSTSTTYTLFVGHGVTKKNVLEATFIPCEPGTVVHTKAMKSHQSKFLIDVVLDKWKDFDSDFHTPGSYVVWDRDQSEVKDVSAVEEEEKEEKDDKKKKKRKGKKKNEKPGERFRKNIKRYTEIEDAEMTEEVDEEGEDSKKTRKARKRKVANVEIDDEEDDEEESEEESDKKTRKKRKEYTSVQEKDKGEEGKKGERKKAKARKTRKVTKITLGKKAADKRKEKNKDKKDEEENVLDYEEEDEEEEEEQLDNKKTKEKKEEERKTWKKGNRRVDPRADVFVQGAKLLDPNSDLWNVKSFVEHFVAFLPVQYIKEEMLPVTNKWAKENGIQPFTYEEFFRVLGIFYMMEVVELPERRMYWMTEGEGFFPGLGFGRAMPVHRFEEFLNLWQFSSSDDMNQQVLDFIDAVNNHLKTVMRAGEVLCVDESMLKSYHRGLNGKMKIIRKPRPIGNELKTVSDASTHIVLHMELHEPKEDMADKEFVQEYGATTACCLRITEHWKGSGRIVVGDSWFGSVKTCLKLYNVNGLYSNMLVKTAHKRYPRFMLRETKLERGEWTSAVAEIDGLKIMATRFLDLKEKMFISSCSTDLSGPARKTKYHGLVPRPQVAFDYLSTSASIDIHNHFRTGSTGLEDAWQTKNAHVRQVAGVLGFLFTNAYMAYRHFRNSTMKHSDFKVKLANALMGYIMEQHRTLRLSNNNVAPAEEADAKVHVLVLLEKPFKGKDGEERDFQRYQKYCFYCQHNPVGNPSKQKTSFHCKACVGPNGQVYPLCQPSTGRSCFQMHIVNGLPPKQRHTQNQ